MRGFDPRGRSLGAWQTSEHMQRPARRWMRSRRQSFYRTWCGAACDCAMWSESRLAGALQQLSSTCRAVPQGQGCAPRVRVRLLPDMRAGLLLCRRSASHCETEASLLEFANPSLIARTLNHSSLCFLELYRTARCRRVGAEAIFTRFPQVAALGGPSLFQLPHGQHKSPCRWKDDVFTKFSVRCA